MGFLRREQPKPIQHQHQQEPFVRQTVMAKVKMGQPGDKFEKEADATADKVVNKTSGGAENVQAMQEEEKVQQQPIASGISSVQKKDLAGDEEPVQSKAEGEKEEPVQAKEDEEPVQAKEDEEPVQTKEDEEPVQMKEDEEPVQTKEDEEPVQMKEDEEPVQTKEDEEPVQSKATAAPKPKSATSIESKLKTTKGGGQKLSGKAKSDMEAGFGADFSNVNIHTDGKAAEMSDQIGAQAFTHGNDVYFNLGKYDPASQQGKHLLAHELTHTIQQSGMVQKKIQRYMQETYPWKGIIANTWSAALRKTPSKEQFIMNLPANTTVTVVSNVGNWLKLKANVQGEIHQGYVSQELVDLDVRATNQDSRKANQEKLKQKSTDKNKFNTYPTVDESTGWLFSEKGVQTAYANNLAELGTYSLLNYDVVYLQGQIREKIKKDPDMMAKQQKIIDMVRRDPKYKKEAFYISGTELVGFGGQRWTAKNENWGSKGNDNPLMHKETWQVGGNELTWALRNATVRYWAEVDIAGNITISYHLNDRLDLSGSKGRSEAYNNISEAMGKVYHDIAGGNENLQTRAEWSTTIVSE